MKLHGIFPPLTTPFQDDGALALEGQHFDGLFRGDPARFSHLVVVPGDLTAAGYEEQFAEAAEWLQRIECPSRLVVPGV